MRAPTEANATQVVGHSNAVPCGHGQDLVTLHALKHQGDGLGLRPHGDGQNFRLISIHAPTVATAPDIQETQ